MSNQFPTTYQILLYSRLSITIFKIMKTRIAFFFCITFFSCQNKIYLHRIETYLNSSTPESKGRYLSDDFRSFFLEKKGEGKNKATALRSFVNWDAPLHPDITISKWTVRGNTWIVDFNEQNDFSKLIGFPGRKGTERISFNSQKMIYEAVYIPNPDNPSYKPWLQPAVEWLEQHRPNDLNEVYINGKLVQTSETAKKWVDLLQLWRKKTRR